MIVGANVSFHFMVQGTNNTNTKDKHKKHCTKQLGAYTHSLKADLKLCVVYNREKGEGVLVQM